MKRKRSVYECVLGSDRITEILVAYYNIIIAKGHYSKQWSKKLDAMLEKGKEMTLGKLRIIMLIETDL